MAEEDSWERKNAQNPEQIVRKFRKMRHVQVRPWAGVAIPVAVCRVVDPALHRPCATPTGKRCARVHAYVVAWGPISAQTTYRGFARNFQTLHDVGGIIRANCDRGVEGAQWTVSSKTTHPADTKMCQLTEAPYLVVFYICDVLARPH
jgi:hypothetical protein